MYRLPFSRLLLVLLCVGLLATAPSVVEASNPSSLTSTVGQGEASPPDTLAARDDAERSPEGTATDAASRSASSTPSADEDEPHTRVSGQVFANYNVNTTGTGATEHFNSFELNRWYFTVNSSLSDQIDFRGTTDVRLSDTGYELFVKYAYVDWTLQPGLDLRAGVQQTGWQNYVNSVWGYRGVARTMAQYQGHLSMADLGIGLIADLPSNLGQASVRVLNGEGFRSAEANRFKGLNAQVQLSPFDASSSLAPVQVGGHVYTGRFTDERPSDRLRQRWGGMVSYRGEDLTLAVNYEGRKDGDVQAAGVSGFGTLQVAEVPSVGAFSLLGLVDLYDVDDPGAAEDAGQMVRTIVGLAYAPTPGFTLSLDYQRDHTDTATFQRYDGTSTDSDARLFLHLILSY